MNLECLISVQEIIDKSSKTAEEFFTKKISEVQKITDEHTKSISDIRNVNSKVNPTFDKEFVEEYIEQRILTMQRNDKLADDSIPQVCDNLVEIEKNANAAEWAVIVTTHCMKQRISQAFTIGMIDQIMKMIFII